MWQALVNLGTKIAGAVVDALQRRSEEPMPLPKAKVPPKLPDPKARKAFEEARRKRTNEKWKRLGQSNDDPHH